VDAIPARARSGSGPRLPARGAMPRLPRRAGLGARRAVAAACVALACARSPSFLAEAQMDLAPTIAGRAGWPCVEQAWSDCAVRFAPGGLTPAEWYEETRFEASEYPAAVDADGAPVGEPGVEVAVGTARALYDALENRDVSRIRVLNSFSLPDLRDWRWPDEGYPVRRDLALFADPACAAASARDEEREEEDADAAARGEVADDGAAVDAPSTASDGASDGACVVDARKKTFLVVSEVGGVIMSDMTLENGGGRLGGIVHVRPGGKASFRDCAFRGGAFAPLSARAPNRPATPRPSVPGVADADGIVRAYGGAVFVVNDDRLRTAEELAAARAAVAGTTAADSVTLGVAHNVTFSRCSFANNAAVGGGDGGAVYARTAGSGFIIFDDCFFRLNRADAGRGGAVYASGGRVVVFESRFDGNVAESAGAVYARAGGLIGASVFSNNVAQSGSGGALFGVLHDTDTNEGRVQNSFFRGNNARVAGGAAFVVGRWRFWNNEHDAIGNTVAAEGVVAHPEVYSCASSTGGEPCVAYTPETAFALEPEYAPFAEQNQPPPVYVRPAEASVAEADASAASGTDALSGIVAPADFVTDSSPSAEGGADGTAPSEPSPSEPPPPPLGDAGGDDGGYRRR